MSIVSVIPFTISSSVTSLFFSIFSKVRVFCNESALLIRWPKYWSFSFSVSPSNEYSGLISFRSDWLDLFAPQATLKNHFQHHSLKASILQHSAFFMAQLSHLCMTTWKIIALTRRTFVGKVMPLLFNMLSRLVITFLSSSKHILISWLQSPSVVSLEPKKINLVTVSTPHPPSIYLDGEGQGCLACCSPWGHKELDKTDWLNNKISLDVMGPDAMISVFRMLSFKPAFSLSSFIFIKRLIISSSFSTARVVSFAYLWFLIFLWEILIPAYDSSSPTLHMMYSAYKLNKQGDIIQLCHTPFPNLNQSIVPCLVLTVASWPVGFLWER